MRKQKAYTVLIYFLIVNLSGFNFFLEKYNYLFLPTNLINSKSNRVTSRKLNAGLLKIPFQF